MVKKSWLLLSVDQSPCSLTISTSFGSKVLCVTRFAVDFAIFFRLSGRLQTLPTLGTAKAVLVPRLSSALHLLCSIHRLPTACTLLCPSKLLSKLRWVRVGGGPMSLGLLRFDAQPLAAVHVERSCPLAVPVSFRAVLFTITGFAVDFLLVAGQRSAV